MSNSLSDSEMQTILEKMDNETDIKMFKRYQTIFLWSKGMKLQEIATLIQVSRRTVINYINSYKEEGIDGLIPIKPKGRSKYLTDEQEAELKDDIINNTPVDFEFIATYNWTADIVRTHIKNKFDVDYSRSGANKLLHRLGLSFTRPTYTLEKADPEEQEEFKEEFEDLKKN